jgi:serine protease Do
MTKLMKSKLSWIIFLLAIFSLVTSVTSCRLINIAFQTPSASVSTPDSASPVSPNTVTSIPQATTGSPTIEPVAITPATSSTPFPDFISVIAAVRPSVVAITTQVTGYSLFGSPVTQSGAGSGWIIDPNGYIVTNNHVVEGASTVTVTLQDGRTFTASKVYTDSVADLAIVRIDAQNLPALKVGDSSQLQVGQWVVAIGNSLGMGISATKGIVSALGVTLSEDAGNTLYDLIQTDAAINPGNSGGPLVDLSGNVVGINSAKVSAVGVEGMGYSISTKTAIPVINDLIKNGFVVRPYFGADFYTVDSSIARRYRLSVNAGALVTQIYTGGPADKAGIKAGDVIVSIDNKVITTADDLSIILQSDKVGQQVQITYNRNGSQNTVTVTLTQTSPS